MADSQDGSPAKRRGTRQVAAREEARLRAAQYTARETERQDIAVRYLMAREEITDREAAVERRIVAERAKLERRIEELRVQLETPLAQLRQGADGLVVEMLATGVSQQEAAGRLGITAAEVGRARRESEQTPETDTPAGQEVPVPPAGQVPQQAGQPEKEPASVGTEPPGSGA